MLVLLALAALGASPEGAARALLRAIDTPSPRRPPEPFDVQAVLWSELPSYGAAACAAIARGEPVESDPIGTIASLPPDISDRLFRVGVAQNVERLRAARCRVTGPKARSMRRPDAPSWLDTVEMVDIVPLACEQPGSILGLALITRRGQPPRVADVVRRENAGGYQFLLDLLVSPRSR